MTKPTDAFQVQPEGFHSAEDARRMQQMANAMLADRRHLALTCSDPELLAHYSRLMVRDLRRHPQVKVLPHLPSNSESLLDHINRLLADMPVDQVLDRQVAAHRPVQVLVVPDTPQLSAESLTLLVRLVNDLPGANLRLVLVQARDLAVTESLRALGPQLLHWNILPPGMTAAQVAHAERAREALRAAMQAGPQDDLSGGRADPRASAGRRTGRRDVTAVPALGPTAPGAKAAPAWARSAKPTGGVQPAPAFAARAGRKAPTTTQRHWMLLTGGLVVSAALAAALGLWISTHTPAPRPMSQAAPSTAPQP